VRKLAWFVIFLLIGLTAWALSCAFIPGVSTASYDIGVNWIGAGIVNGFTNVMTGMMAWGATGLGPAVAVFLGTGIGFTVLWLVLLRKYVWTPLRSAKKVIQTVSAPAPAPTPTVRATEEPSTPVIPEAKEKVPA